MGIPYFEQTQKNEKGIKKHTQYGPKHPATFPLEQCVITYINRILPWFSSIFYTKAHHHQIPNIHHWPQARAWLPHTKPSTPEKRWTCHRNSVRGRWILCIDLSWFVVFFQSFSSRFAIKASPGVLLDCQFGLFLSQNDSGSPKFWKAPIFPKNTTIW